MKTLVKLSSIAPIVLPTCLSLLLVSCRSAEKPQTANLPDWAVTKMHLYRMRIHQEGILQLQHQSEKQFLNSEALLTAEALTKN